MNPQARQLAAQLTTAFNGGGTASARPWLWRPLLRLLAQGEPVTAAQLARATGRTTGEVLRALAANPDTEYDAEGRITGSALTLNPTPHHYETGGIRLYTWCALDTLFLPAVLGRPARVTSPCHATGQPITLTISPGRITSVEPATAVVSLVTPDAPASIRTAFCNQVLFFASPGAAGDWLDQHPGATILPVTDAHELSRPLTETLLSGDTPPTCSPAANPADDALLSAPSPNSSRGWPTGRKRSRDWPPWRCGTWPAGYPIACSARA